jgi:copper(I)-binding protein
MDLLVRSHLGRSACLIGFLMPNTGLRTITGTAVAGLSAGPDTMAAGRRRRGADPGGDRMFRRIAGSIALAALALGACGSDDGMRVDGAWARTSPAMANAGAAYMQLTSPEADRLLGVSVPQSVAARAEIHETVMSGDAMAMQQVEAIELPAGQTVSLEPGGYHVMLLELAEPLEAGETFELTLDFERAGDVVVVIEVRDQAP